MFTIFDSKSQLVPIKVWLNNGEQLEEECLQQALNLSNLPFAYHHICLMADTHSGFGMPIGGVLAADGVIIPNAVGVDIGCGMGFIETNIKKEKLSKEILQNLVGNIMRNIPTGFSRHKKKQSCIVLDLFVESQGEFLSKQPAELVKEIEQGYYQLGTLGGGNHFIEIQEDQQNNICIMVHSGSRNFGYKVANHFNSVAKELNNKWNNPIPVKYDLAFLPLETREGQDYFAWMNLALNFAAENRQRMLAVVMDSLSKSVPSCQFRTPVNAHHNYASMEQHFEKEVVVHRKGAIRAAKGDLGIIPGAMGSFSYIVEGLGNPESFQTCSHGAGRVVSRKKARETIAQEKTILDLKQLGVVLGKSKKDDISEESRFAYKDIEQVIDNQLDLVKPVKKLKTLAVIKG